MRTGEQAAVNRASVVQHQQRHTRGGRKESGRGGEKAQSQGNTKVEREQREHCMALRRHIQHHTNDTAQGLWPPSIMKVREMAGRPASYAAQHGSKQGGSLS